MFYHVHVSTPHRGTLCRYNELTLLYHHPHILLCQNATNVKVISIMSVEMWCCTRNLNTSLKDNPLAFFVIWWWSYSQMSLNAAPQGEKGTLPGLNRKTMDAILCKLSLYYRRHGKICWAKRLPIVVFVETFSHCLDQKCWLYSTIKERGAYIHGKTFMDSWKLQKPRKFSPANLSIFTAFKLLCLMTYNLNDLHMCI